MRRHAAVLMTVLAGALLLSGCGTPSEASVPSPTASVSPTPPPPPPNDLGAERIAQIARVECPGVVTEDAVRMLVQPKADAVDFFSSTHQCGDIASVLAVGDDA